MRHLAYSLLATADVLLDGCDALGIESAEKLAAVREADGKAIGSACRHAGRAIEDCYLLNAKAQRAAVFAGWREMDEYMRENKLEAVAPTLARGVPAKAGPPVAAAKDADAESAEPAPTPKPAKPVKSHS
jgi:hypothetical protein